VLRYSLAAFAGAGLAGISLARRSFSIFAAIFGFSLRNCLAASLPWPIFSFS
jgi:hypothetical protein